MCVFRYRRWRPQEIEWRRLFLSLPSVSFVEKQFIGIGSVFEEVVVFFVVTVKWSKFFERIEKFSITEVHPLIVL